MNYSETVFHWFGQHSFTAVSLVFGGAVIAVLLYTYVHDYQKFIRHE